MPGCDGHALCQNLRSSHQTKDLIIIACSGNVFADDQQLARVSGFSDFLPKPVTEDELFQILGRHLQLKWIYADGNESTNADQTNMATDETKTGPFQLDGENAS